MTNVWALAALWLALALLAALAAAYLRISTALAEIVVGTIAQATLAPWFGASVLDAGEGWIAFLAGAGAIMLTFLAGAELDPAVFRQKWREASALGAAGFFLPFLGCTIAAYFLLHWDGRASWLGGIAMSTTSVAVVYAVMLETGLNKTPYGKVILAACFVNDLGTVLALGFIFAPFDYKTLVFALLAVAAFIVIPWATPRLFRRHGDKPSELEAKYLLLALFALGALAAWAGSEAVLPAYVLGLLLAGSVGRDHALIRRLRTLTLGLMTPFYFIRAGSYVSLTDIVAAPAAFLIMFATKVLSKSVGVYPVTQFFGSPRREALYTTMMMSTGLTFGTISALFGLTNHIIDQGQYSALVAAVIATAVIPTLIGNIFFLPHHLIPKPVPVVQEDV